MRILFTATPLVGHVYPMLPLMHAAQDAGRDYTVDWVHLKLNDQAQRTVLLKDPFRSSDDRVTKLIEAM